MSEAAHEPVPPADPPAPPPPPAEPEKKDAALTEYLVLSKDADKDWWMVVGTLHARSAKSAITEHVKRVQATAGTFVATPSRSWQPVTLAIETQTKISLT